MSSCKITFGEYMGIITSDKDPILSGLLHRKVFERTYPHVPCLKTYAVAGPYETKGTTEDFCTSMTQICNTLAMCVFSTLESPTKEEKFRIQISANYTLRGLLLLGGIEAITRHDSILVPAICQRYNPTPFLTPYPLYQPYSPLSETGLLSGETVGDFLNIINTDWPGSVKCFAGEYLWTSTLWFPPSDKDIHFVYDDEEWNCTCHNGNWSVDIRTKDGNISLTLYDGLLNIRHIDDYFSRQKSLHFTYYKDCLSRGSWDFLFHGMTADFAEMLSMQESPPDADYAIIRHIMSVRMKPLLMLFKTLAFQDYGQQYYQTELECMKHPVPCTDSPLPEVKQFLGDFDLFCGGTYPTYMIPHALMGVKESVVDLDAVDAHAYANYYLIAENGAIVQEIADAKWKAGGTNLTCPESNTELVALYELQGDNWAFQRFITPHDLSALLGDGSLSWTVVTSSAFRIGRRVT